jgi:hypothetical protein
MTDVLGGIANDLRAMGYVEVGPGDWQPDVLGGIAGALRSAGYTEVGPGNWQPPTQSGPTPPEVTGEAPLPIPIDEAGDSAAGALRAALGTYGLGGLGDKVWAWHKAGVPLEQILLDIRSSPEYNARFPAMSVLAGKGRALSEDEYINYEQSVASVMRQYGIPAGFFDAPDDFARYLVNDISVQEIADRVQLAASIVYNASPTDRYQLQTLYGVNDGAAIAYMLDPAKAQPLLQKQYNAVKAASAWSLSQLGQLTQGEAESLASLDPSQTQQAIGNLGRMRELFTPLDSGENAIGRGDQIGALTGDVSDQEAIARRGERRTARFSGGGSYGQTKEGLSV